MARIFKDSSVLNQFGSPSLNSNTLANRPAFGQVGRLFVDTTNNVIYRDTGTSWDLIGGGGGSQNLQQVTTVGNTTDQGINVLSNSGLYVTSDGNIANRPTSFPFATYSVGFNVLQGAYNINDANINVGAILQSVINVNVTATKNTFFNANFSNLDLNIPTGSILTLDINANNGAVLALNSFSGAGGGSIVNTQAGGAGFRAISPLVSKTNYTSLTNNITIDYYAGINIYGAEGITSTGKLSIGQYYSLLINPSDYFANSPIITGNRWGIYQAGANDNNYFAAKINIGNGNITFNSSQLNVIGTSQFISTSTSGTSIILGNAEFQWNFNTSIFKAILSLGYGANNVLNIGFDAPDGLIKIYNAGNIQFSTNYFSVGGDANNPISSARMNIESTTKGALIPRMTTAQIKAILSPVNGLLAYSTDDFVLSFYDSSTSLWKRVVHLNL
jgi:hypothetical protein